MTTARRFLAPEIIQASKMDCGPAALKCLLEGFGLNVGYGRLREACQTDVDGTSIDVIEDVACQLGLDAEQQMVPAEHLCLSKATPLPALVVFSVPPAGNHFVVVWRRHGSLFQVMDPSIGRRWLSRDELLRDLYRHTMRVPAQDLREWAGSPKFLLPLRERLEKVGLPAHACDRLVAFACADDTCLSLGALDAATRLVERLVLSRALPRGGRLEPLLARLTSTRKEAGTIPESFWAFWPVADEPEAEEAFLRGAVLVSLRKPNVREPNAEAREITTELRPELMRALNERTESPWAAVLRYLREDGLSAPAVVVGAMVVAAAGVAAQALVLRGLLEIGRWLGTGSQRLGAVAAVLVLLASILLVMASASAASLRIGRRLEIRLRTALLEKIPRMRDAYFQSRLVSDMAERAHAIAGLRALPKLTFGVLGTVFQLLFTIAAIVWQQPSSAPVVLGVSAVAITAGWLSQPWMNERDLRVRGHNAALGRYNLDALMGLWCLRAHGGATPLLREQETLLVQWSGAQVRLQRLAVLIEGGQAAMGYGLAGWLLFRLHTGQEGHALLLAFWALQLPMLGQSLVVLSRQIPTQRNITERLLEPLGTPEEANAVAAHEAFARPPTRGPHLSLRNVTVRAGGQPLLEDLSVEIAAGTHVAIVGESGAGKSTLLGLLLGWHRPAPGEILADGRPLSDEAIAKLRRETAWVDPAVQLWNRRFIDNLTYAADASSRSTNEVGWAVEAADLREVLERLPEGLQTPLGEGGALISGGEGQRVRLGRALMQKGVRLAILDEPFRGLDRGKRSELLRRTRALWSHATLLCATHDVTETLQFDRVLVVGSGRVLEDGNPAVLARSSGSHYAQMLAAERAVREGLWEDPAWRRIRVEHGTVREESREAPTTIEPPIERTGGIAQIAARQRPSHVEARAVDG